MCKGDLLLLLIFGSACFWSNNLRIKQWFWVLQVQLNLTNLFIDLFKLSKNVGSFSSKYISLPSHNCNQLSLLSSLKKNNILYLIRFSVIKLYSWGIIQNINEAIPVTDWSSEWQTENVKIFNIQIICITQSKFYNLYFEWYKENKKTLVSEWICEWLRDKHVHRGASLRKTDMRYYSKRW